MIKFNVESNLNKLIDWANMIPIDMKQIINESGIKSNNDIASYIGSYFDGWTPEIDLLIENGEFTVIINNINENYLHHLTGESAEQFAERLENIIYENILDGLRNGGYDGN